MGKASYATILNIWNDNTTMFLTLKDHANFVKTSLVGMYFVYEYPDTPVSIHFIVPDCYLRLP